MTFFVDFSQGELMNNFAIHSAYSAATVLTSDAITQVSGGHSVLAPTTGQMLLSSANKKFVEVVKLDEQWCSKIDY